MAGNIFMHIFKGRNASEFKSVAEVNNFIAKETGHSPIVKNVSTGLCKNRGSVFPIKKENPDSSVDQALKHHR
jgi:hypothetical protein